MEKKREVGRPRKNINVKRLNTDVLSPLYNKVSRLRTLLSEGRGHKRGYKKATLREAVEFCIRFTTKHTDEVLRSIIIKEREDDLLQSTKPNIQPATPAGATSDGGSSQPEQG